VDLAYLLQPDAVLMDIKLGNGMDGIQAADEIGRIANPQIIYLTAHATGKTLDRALQSQPAAFLHKPVRQKELAATLRLVLENHHPSLQCDVPCFSTLNIANRFGGTLAQALDHLPTGVMLVDADLQIIYLNSRARIICQLSRQVSIQNNRLVTNQAAHAIALQQRIKSLSEVCDQNVESVSALRLSGPENGALEFLIAPVQADRENDQMMYPRALLFLFDQQQYHGILSNLLTSLYGLTVAEARLAARLARNQTLEESAGALEITLNTARTHLKRIFTKTRTHRQSELIHRIDTGPAGLLLQMSDD
jgi:DNA-binding NarL/FixJ family response regulator